MKKIRSVNLGGWFVLERWMTPSLFDDNKIVGNDETCFSNQSLSKEKVLNEHYSTWITKQDILWLKDIGVNLVRIPIPWWLYGDGIYHKSVEFLDEVLETLNEIELDFMLDLHTAPGCQNGFDNGGIQNVLDWPKDTKNIDKTIEVLSSIMKRYDNLKHFHSLQLLNEPFISIEITLLADFYQRAYSELRKINKNRYIIMHDGFRLNAWEDFFKTNNFHNVILDTHMYQCFDDSLKDFTIEQHIAHSMKRTELLQKVEEYVPCIVGEWSLGLLPNKHLRKDNEVEILTKYASAQLIAMRECTGHIFWSYKVEKYNSGWNFRDLIQRGIIDMQEYLQ